MTFASEPLEPAAEALDTGAQSRGEPALPSVFTRRGERLTIAEVVRTWRSTNVDRGDAYLARHWYEVRAVDGRVAVLYFDRKARRGSARWWLYTLEGAR